MASHPDDPVLKFTIRLSDSSYKKNIIKLKAGDDFRVFGPMGDFSITSKNKGIVFLISGIGITPILPFLKDLEKSNYGHPIYLFYSNRTEEKTTYHEELKSIKLRTYIHKRSRKDRGIVAF
jgi:ferredoxin-NADP reductase